MCPFDVGLQVLFFFNAHFNFSKPGRTHARLKCASVEHEFWNAGTEVQTVLPFKWCLVKLVVQSAPCAAGGLSRPDQCAARISAVRCKGNSVPARHRECGSSGSSDIRRCRQTGTCTHDIASVRNETCRIRTCVAVRRTPSANSKSPGCCRACIRDTRSGRTSRDCHRAPALRPCHRTRDRCIAATSFPIHCATAVSNRFTNTLPMSRRYQSSQTLQRKYPQSSGSTDQSVTTESGLPG